MYVMFINVSISVIFKNSFTWVKCPFKWFTWPNHAIFKYDLHLLPLTYLPRLKSNSTSRLEAVQRKAIKIILLFLIYLVSYCFRASWHFLFKQDVRISPGVFRSICQPDNCLYHLLPHPRDLAVTSCLRKLTVYPRPSLRTKRYYSAVYYALINFQ